MRCYYEKQAEKMRVCEMAGRKEAGGNENAQRVILEGR